MKTRNSTKSQSKEQIKEHSDTKTSQVDKQ